MTASWQGAIALGLLVGCGCSPASSKVLAPNAELLDRQDASPYVVQSSDAKVVERHRATRDDVTVVAVQARPLTRAQLRGVARSFAGKAKMPNIQVYASDAVHAACVRYRFGVVRQSADPADAKACNEGTLLYLDQSEPRVLYWGAGAPSK